MEPGEGPDWDFPRLHSGSFTMKMTGCKEQSCLSSGRCRKTKKKKKKKKKEKKEKCCYSHIAPGFKSCLYYLLGLGQITSLS